VKTAAPKHYYVRINLSLPPADAILQEGMRLADTLADSLVDIQAKKWSVYARDTYFAGLKGGSNHNPVFIGGEFGGGGVVVTPDGTLVGSDNEISGYGFDTVDVEGQRLVFGEKLTEVLETPTSKNTLVVLIYGSNQFVGENVGFENLGLQLDEYPHLLQVSPGHNPFDDDPHFNQEEAFFEIKKGIEQALANNPQIENIALAGYSWGGGMLYDVAEWLQSHEEYKSIEIVAAAYVDAITLNSFTAENRTPPGVQNMINIYQSNADIRSDITLNGGKLSGTSNLKVLQEIDLDEFDNFHSHVSIDESSVPFINSFLRSIIRIK
jgi:hypothetical protein|tara:strand:+ start:4728 stop:5696 length:969 start_codon:yes stop_codon:yes gene_type:complete